MTRDFNICVFYGEVWLRLASEPLAFTSMGAEDKDLLSAIIIGKDPASVKIHRLKFVFTPCSLSSKNTTVTPRAIIILMGSDRGRYNLSAVCVNLCGKNGPQMLQCGSKMSILTRKGAEIRTTTIPAPQCQNQKELQRTAGYTLSDGPNITLVRSQQQRSHRQTPDQYLTAAARLQTSYGQP